MMKPFIICLAIALCSRIIAGEQNAVVMYTDDGFRVPQAGAALEFPRDHGNHPEYKIEWWYLTGHLQASDGERFGFQATFFRFALPRETPESGSDSFRNDHLFSSQAALSMIDRGEFLFDERFDRNGWDAYSSEQSLDHRHGDWGLSMVDLDTEEMKLEARLKDRAKFDFKLEPSKPLVIFGEDGTSRKGEDPGARSFYLTYPRLAVSGTIDLDSERLEVVGDAWMDHEIASQQLSDNLEGWDWTAIQLEEGREIKAYILRQRDGEPSPYSRLIWVESDGEKTYLGPDEFKWIKEKVWKSPHTGTEYPTTVRIKAKDPKTGQERIFRILPQLDDQEVRGDLIGTYYWEGACKVLNEASERLGDAYLELAGYEDALGEALR